MRASLTLYGFLFCLVSFSQNSETLRLDQFYRSVFTNHPLAKQAELIRKRGQLELSGSRGFFDPKLYSDYSHKEFDGKTYYDLWDSYLKLPTALNVDFKVGFEQNSGYYLDPEHKTPGTGLYYAGVSVPIGQGLFINEQTYALRKGKLTRQELENEAVIVLNNLLLDANYTYWQWNASFQKMKLYEEALGLAEFRAAGIKQAVITGEEASIDSVEIMIQVQTFKNEFSKAQAEYFKNSLALQNMLWSDTISGLSAPSDSLLFPNNSLGYYEEYATISHPDLKAVDIKTSQLQVDRRMYAEQLKPNLDLNYNFLMGAQGAPASQQGFQQNNYKGGINFSMPLLLRKERSKFNLAKVKISENELKRDLKTREVLNKIKANYNLVDTYQAMIRQQQAAVRNYELMLEGERSKFNNGESSVFYVNTRETKLIDARLKLIELEMTYRIYIGQLLWSSGYLPEFVESL